MPELTITKHEGMGLAPARRLLHAKQRWDDDQASNTTGIPIHQAFRLAAVMHCADRKDKIYGILGLLPEPQRDRLRPDYSMNNQDLYRHTMMTAKLYEDICSQDLRRFIQLEKDLREALQLGGRRLSPVSNRQIQWLSNGFDIDEQAG